MHTSPRLLPALLLALVTLIITSDSSYADDGPPAHLRRVVSDWKTDWSKSAIDLGELMSGGPPRDGIPPLDNPKFVSTLEAASWLDGREPVLALEIGGQARAYPLQILIFHEIVNDTVGGTPVAITFCPLCNSAMVFDRRIDGRTLTYGTSGLLRNSDLVMWDRQTESLWQQVTGEAIVGALTGARLTYLPSQLVSFAEFKSAHPAGEVLSRETGHRRPYGQNPYVGYDAPNQNPFLYRGKKDNRLPPMARLVTFGLGDKYYGIPYSALEENGVAQKTIEGVDLVAFYKPGTTSALDGRSIAASRDVGSTGLFKAVANGKKLTFKRVVDGFVDQQTGSTWNIFGEAVSGEMKGARLGRIPSGDHFWFAWYAFRPETTLLQ